MAGDRGFAGSDGFRVICHQRPVECRHAIALEPSQSDVGIRDFLVTGGRHSRLDRRVFMRLNLIDGGNFNTVLAVHIHTMIVGFFLMILMAAASKLVPMFMLSPEQPQYGSWVAGIALNLIMFATYFGFNSLDSHFRSLLSVTLLAAILAYFSQLTYFALKKRRKWDAGMTLFYLANFMLLPAWWQFFRFHSLPDAGATSASIDTLRAGVFIVTFLAFNGCILGMSQKIVPFMLWHHLYAKHLGKAKVPQTVDLLHAWTLWPIAGSYLLSALLYLIALKGQNAALIRPATVFMLLAFFFVACNAPQFINHWKTPVLIHSRRNPRQTDRDSPPRSLLKSIRDHSSNHDSNHQFSSP